MLHIIICSLLFVAFHKVIICCCGCNYCKRGLYMLEELQAFVKRSSADFLLPLSTINSCIETFCILSFIHWGKPSSLHIISNQRNLRLSWYITEQRKLPGLPGGTVKIQMIQNIGSGLCHIHVHALNMTSLGVGHGSVATDHAEGRLIHGSVNQSPRSSSCE